MVSYNIRNDIGEINSFAAHKLLFTYASSSFVNGLDCIFYLMKATWTIVNIISRRDDECRRKRIGLECWKLRSRLARYIAINSSGVCKNSPSAPSGENVVVD